jgi:hypothetical protein
MLYDSVVQYMYNKYGIQNKIHPILIIICYPFHETYYLIGNMYNDMSVCIQARHHSVVGCSSQSCQKPLYVCKFQHPFFFGAAGGGGLFM